MRHLILFGVALTVLCGCVTPGRSHSKVICSEYHDLHCLTPPECSMDEKRGCMVCQCSPLGRNSTGTEL